MDITQLIEKAIAGTLTDADKAKLKAYKPTDTAPLTAEIERLQAALNEANGAKAKGDAGLEAMRKQVEALTKTVAEEKAAREAAAKEAADIRRAQAIDDIRAKQGIHFIDGISPDLAKGAFASAFKDVADLADAAAVKGAVEAFRKANAGLIRAPEGGHNVPLGGTHPHEGAPVDADAMAKTLAEAGIIKPAK